MPLPRKAVLWAYLKKARDAGHITLDGRQYVQYTESDFEEIMRENGLIDPTQLETADDMGDDTPIGGGFDWDQRRDEIRTGGAEPREVAASQPNAAPVATGDPRARRPQSGPQAAPLAGVSPMEQARHLGVEVRDLPEERAGLHFSDEPNTAIRVDSQGRVWYQDEVMKPAIPKPRMTRRQRYIDPGVQEIQTTRPDGGLDETFEIAGTEKREMTVVTTVPSWQVGIYHDERFPFRVVTYNGIEGFLRTDVAAFYGGSKMIPPTIETTYVGQSLCYDMRTARITMEEEYRNEVLRNRN